jgi:hypothetical protein
MLLGVLLTIVLVLLAVGALEKQDAQARLDAQAEANRTRQQEYDALLAECDKSYGPQFRAKAIERARQYFLDRGYGAENPPSPEAEDLAIRLAYAETAKDNQNKGQVFRDLAPANPEGRGFFGVGGADAAKIVYVVDRSGSMTDTIDYVKNELKRSISELPDKFQFHVIFFSSDPPVEMPTRGLVQATEDNKQLAYQFIGGVMAQGETNPSTALKLAFSYNPEVIYLLTDGEFDRGIIGLVMSLNFRDKVTVHTIGFLYKTGENALKLIASGNRGNYKFVSEEDVRHKP